MTGRAPTTLYVRPRIAGLDLGIYTDTIRIRGTADTQNSPQIVEVRLTVGTGKVYLPLTIKNWPPFPGVPQLLPIHNPENRGDYTVSWNAANLAASYELQSARNTDFTLDVIDYESTENLSQDISDKGAAIHYYRVRSINQWGKSAWSNVQQTHVRWESGDNDKFSESDGPLVSGVEYYGYPEDNNDHFKIIVSSPGQIKVQLTNALEGWLEIYYEIPGSDPPVRTRVDGKSHQGTITLQVAATNSGLYHIRIYTASPNSNATSYRLTVTYP